MCARNKPEIIYVVCVCVCVCVSLCLSVSLCVSLVSVSAYVLCVCVCVMCVLGSDMRLSCMLLLVLKGLVSTATIEDVLAESRLKLADC